MVRINDDYIEIVQDPIVIDIADAVAEVQTALEDYLKNCDSRMETMPDDDYCRMFDYILEAAKYHREKENDESGLIDYIKERTEE